MRIRAPLRSVPSLIPTGSGPTVFAIAKDMLWPLAELPPIDPFMVVIRLSRLMLAFAVEAALSGSKGDGDMCK